MYKYKRNSHYFADHSDLQVCSDAGFLWGDGNVRAYDKPELQVTLAPKDIRFLERMKNRIGYEGPIPLRTRGKYSLNVLSVYDKKIINDLKFFGVVPNKTYNPVIPNLVGEQKLAFIAGLHMADGCLTRERYPRWETCSNKPEILAWARESLCDLAPLNIEKHPTVYRIRACGSRAKAINDLLTSLPIDYMKRKTYAR